MTDTKQPEIIAPIEAPKPDGGVGTPPSNSSASRRKTLQPWLKRYNEVRPHGSLGKKPPFSRMEASK